MKINNNKPKKLFVESYIAVEEAIERSKNLESKWKDVDVELLKKYD
jgi:hypothetical protein